MDSAIRVTTGYAGLDKILDGLRIGDNVVWKVDSMADYRYFVGPFVDAALREGKRVIYMRFGDHEPLLGASPSIVVHQLDPRRGFESFAARIHSILSEEGHGAFYVFDCLSDLLSAWATDYMVGNFFRVTCPYLFELDTVAYFALIRSRHSFQTIERIRDTTQVLIDVYNHEQSFHIHPLKVWQRRSPTMFLPHRKEGEQFLPLTASFEATDLFSSIARRDTENAQRHLDHWHRLFLQAQELAGDPAAQTEQQNMVSHICRHMIGREARILELAAECFCLQDLLDIKTRVIGTGFIGGKAVGMLLARQILLRAPDYHWEDHLEAHDSFFVGSNVYYSYIVHNGWWPLFMRQKKKETYFSAAAELRGKMLEGSFPATIREGFHKLLEYYGQYPIIVRSSSLLEDSFGNAFAGKYDSFFCVNQGTPEERLAQFEEAVRKIFASTMSEDALTYRQQRGLDQQDEQMALLIQRVSGAYRGHYFFPELAGVGVSYNTFVWDRGMDPQAGMLRLVLGLGTRAVDRVEGDYPRLIALDAPLKRPHKDQADTRRFSQRSVDLLDVVDNRLHTVSLLDLSRQGVDLPWQLYGVKDLETMRLLENRGRKGEQVWLLTFERLLADTPFASLMQRLLKTLERTYRYPVDVEFTVNFTPQGTARIDVVQCRPLQTKGEQVQVEIPEKIEPERIFFRSEGNFMGGNISQPLRWLVWVEPEEYVQLHMSDKYEIARLIGRLNKRLADRKDNPTLLLGPGRWGTSTPSLGVPISFSEINNFTALAEVAFSSGNLMPELSYGSHFFQDLVETDIFYLALFPENNKCFLNDAWRRAQPNALEGLMPASSRLKHVVKVYRAPKEGLRLMADVVSQQLVCFLER
ncbi:phosphoenolpyruvate synthase [Desulfuromonas versatilis]|uniref:Phosphoenolpyruvate synthase n=1 Tax=Desulfuromonas versatilis TaxID=2802975 RepID=A0ABM8HPK9_9BACT|nr:PEP/pyruvate-binding domain-containing protein [Desulfuromonas versatilis]BCR03566.1 phosphoenolpyruvate synthase [Desulfuromonas versatilis]